MKQIIVSEHIWKEGNTYTSFCPELEIASCGTTVKKAKENLREALEIFIEETNNLGTLEDLLEEAGFQPSSNDEILVKRKEIIEFDVIKVPIEK